MPNAALKSAFKSAMAWSWAASASTPVVAGNLYMGDGGVAEGSIALVGGTMVFKGMVASNPATKPLTAFDDLPLIGGRYFMSRGKGSDEPRPPSALSETRCSSVVRTSVSDVEWTKYGGKGE